MKQWIRKLCGSLAAMLITLAVGQSALAAGAEDILRTAVIVDLQGLAKVQPAGSSLQYDAFEGMALRQGDRLIVGQGSAQLRVEDTRDEINLGEYSLLDISQLSGGLQGRTTKLTMLSGVAYFAVTDLRGKPDTFQVVNGNHTLDVKGTHFIVATDPVTGASIVGVMAGAVSAGSSRPASGGSPNQLPPTVIYPAQQIYLGGGEASGPSGPSVVDPTRLIQNAPANVIESLLRNAEKIQKENEQTKKSLEEQANTPKQPADPSLPLQMGDLNKISENMSNLVGNLAQEAVKQQKLSSGQVQQLIDEANRSLEGNGKIDLDKVQPLDPTAGVDPEA
ncbi:MAG: FecR family protein, partial [Paenibacillaceae bacterium]|nr:FecR family protein [Paenibacillaceae bacterium]